MYPYDDNKEETTNNTPSPDTTSSNPTQADGEYHYIRPDSQRSYSDAEYTPESEATVPPRYFIPDDKPPKEKKSKNKGQLTFTKAACLCLSCALLGGVAGGAVTGHYLNTNKSDNNTPVLSTSQESATPNTSATNISSGGVTASDIYDLGCEQAVGISTEITTTNFFGMPTSGSVSGSGFIITADGYIMTNYHVIEDAYTGGYDVSVMLHDGSSNTATIVGFDKDNDIAVLKIDASGLNAVTFGNSDSLSVGDTVYAIGNPLGELDYTMTSGIISATNRIITTDESTSINMFQFDAAVNSGNSGGPVYNKNGQIVGVVTAKYSDTGVEGLGFAIPINDAVKIANELITNGYVTGKPNMGIVVQTVSASVAQYYNMVQGAFVYSIESGSCSEIAGMKVGDIITELDGAAITTSEELKTAVKQHSAGDSVSVTIYRSGEYITLTVIFDEEQPGTETTTNNTTDGAAQGSGTNGYPYSSGW